VKKKYSTAFIDTSNLFRRSYESLLSRGFQDKELYQKTIYQTFVSIKKIQKDFLWSFSDIYFLFDNPDSKHNLRAELSDEYKKNREKMPKSYYRYLEYFKSILLTYDNNFYVVYIDFLEADDLVLSLIDHIKKDEIVLISADLDWSRCINYKGNDIVWYNFDHLYDKDEFKFKYGFYPTVDKIILYKCLSGDKSDGIKKVITYLSTENIKQLCNDFNTIDELFINLKNISYLSMKFKYRIEENIAQLRINRKLMSFINIEKFGKIRNFIHSCKFKEKELKLYYKGLNIDLSFDKRFNRYTSPFKTPDSDNFFKLDRLPRK